MLQAIYQKLYVVALLLAGASLVTTGILMYVIRRAGGLLEWVLLCASIAGVLLLVVLKNRIMSLATLLSLIATMILSSALWGSLRPGGLAYVSLVAVITTAALGVLCTLARAEKTDDASHSTMG